MWKKLGIYLKGYGRESVLGPLFKLLEATFELFVPLVIASMIDKGIGLGDSGYVWKMGGLLLLLGVVGLVFSITAQYFAARASVGFAARLREALFARVVRLSASQQDAYGPAKLTQRLTGDVDQVQSGLNLALRLMLRSPFVVFGAMVMAFFVDVKSAWVFAVAIPVLSVLVFGIMVLSLPRFSRAQAALDSVMGITRENLTGARVIRAFGREDGENARFMGEANRLNARRREAGHVSALTTPLTSIVINLALVILIYSGALRVESGVITQGELVALVNYMGQILVELIKLANLIVSVTKALACFKRVESVISMPVDMSVEEAAAFDCLAGVAVRFDNVSLTYAGAGEASLKNISFTAMKGDTIGIVGPTGSGKSSVVSLIPRFYDVTQGSISVFGTDVRRIPLSSLRKKIGIVEQKTTLFSGSIEDNVRWGKDDADENEIMEAVSRAQGADIIEKKKDGLNYDIGQGGRALSGGQRQRLSIARALVRRPEILILDDSASALDFATDARLRAAIRSMQGRSTVFIVSQRASSVCHADKILVMEDGLIAAQGTHDELMTSSPLYREIYFSQFPEGEDHA